MTTREQQVLGSPRLRLNSETWLGSSSPTLTRSDLARSIPVRWATRAIASDWTRSSVLCSSWSRDSDSITRLNPNQSKIELDRHRVRLRLDTEFGLGLERDFIPALPKSNSIVTEFDPEGTRESVRHCVSVSLSSSRLLLCFATPAIFLDLGRGRCPSWRGQIPQSEAKSQ